MIWFTSDTHFNHPSIIEYSNRPFSDIDDMTESLIQTWNERVGKGDVVYHLGDFALSWGKKHKQVIDSILSRLNGSKFLICGNHDRDEVKNNPRWAKVCDYHEVRFAGQKIILSHYAMRTWNQGHRGSWMLHGHSHGSLPDIGGKIMDVGVDARGYSPVNFEYVKWFMDKRQVWVEDYHSCD